ncbi:MAG TPA: hypothetical protein VGO00_19345 [Kofleriaceae bacterium]|nr:hypothetical protein [Kofleriaceae bacterium]
MNKTLLAATTLLGFASGCLKQDEPPSELVNAIPTSDQVAIKLPNNGNKSIGQLANWYVATRDVTRTFNGGSAWVLILIHSIVENPVTSVSGNVYTWGPGSGALDPADYKLDVTANADGTYDYVFSGRSKTQANAQFEAIITGHADPRNGDLQGNGNFLLDFDASRRVNPIDSGDGVGTVMVDYDLSKRHLELGIDTTDANTHQPVSATYEYDQAADGGGDMTFSITGDAGGGPALENVVLRSRWLNTGAGRADARLSGGDLAAAGIQVIASECWNTMFGRVFYTDNASFAPTEGDAASCAYATADLPQ